MSSPSVLPLLLLFAVAQAGPLELPEGETPPASTLTPPSLAAAAAAATSAAAAASPVSNDERGIPAATLAPPSDGQYCTVDGGVFHNGERLPASADPDPCRACYCQGGEAVCTRVHCYRRPDCAPRHVPGSCCPKYDNCPPAPEERSPEPRVKDASTQTDPSVETTAAADGNATAATTVPVTATDAAAEQDTEAATAATGTDPTTTTTMTTTPATAAATTEEADEADEADEEASATSAYPPGIDLHALHEHLPFLSPGDANGPNT